MRTNNQLAYLGSALADAGVLDQFPLRGSDFTGHCRELFLAMRRLIDSGYKAVEIGVLFNECPEAMREVGSELADAVACGMAGYYAKEIRKESQLRNLASIPSLLQEVDTVEEKRDAVEKVLLNLDNEEQGAKHVKDIIHQAVRQLDYQQGIRTGLPVDDKFLGFVPSDLVILAGRPGMGKSALAGNIAEYVGRNKKVQVFTLEMSKEQWVLRTACSIGRVNMTRMRRGKMSKEEYGRFVKACEDVEKLNLVIDETPALNVSDLRSRVRREKPDLVIVDYLQLLTCRAESRFEEVSEISRQLKACAKANNVPILALAQLNRSLESRSDKRPKIADLRESGQIEQDADAIMFIYREEEYCDSCKLGLGCNKGHKRKAELDLAKQRNGETGISFMEFFGEFALFTERLDR